MPDATDNRVLSQLMLIQGTLDSMPTDESISRFVSRGLKYVPGVSSLNVCVRGAVAEKNDLCASCNYRWGETEDKSDYLCKLEYHGNTKYLPIRTADRLYGFVVFSLNDTPEAFTPYEPYLQNIVNVLSMSIDNRRQKEALEAFNKQLQGEVEYRKQMAEELLESEQRYHSLFENMLDGFAYCKMLFDEQGSPVDFVYLDVNKAFERLTGLKDVVGKKVSEVMPGIKELNPELFDIYGRVALTGKTEMFEINFKPLEKWLSVSVYSTMKGYFVAVFDDITERKHADTIIRESEERYRMAIEYSNDGVALVEGDRHIYVNRKFLDIFGYENTEDIIGKSPFVLVHPDDREMVLEYNRKRQIGEPVPSKYEFKGIKKDGTNIFIEVSAAKITYHGKTVSLAYLRDMTERKHLEEQLLTMSISDELTGLYNRRGFFTLAQQQMKVTERTKKDMLLFFADLDKMKQINDTLGHQEGDKALIEIATILKEVFRESDIIGRMGGDEFAILAIDTTDDTGEVLMKRLHNYLDDYNRPEGRSYQLSLSIGIAHYNPETPSTLDELMAQADTLMYEEKKGKKN